MDLVGEGFQGCPEYKSTQEEGFISLPNPHSGVETREAPDLAQSLVLQAAFCIVSVKGCCEIDDLADGSIKPTFSFTPRLLILRGRTGACVFATASIHQNAAGHPLALGDGGGAL